MTRELGWLKPVAIALVVGAVFTSVALVQNLVAIDRAEANKCAAVKIKAVAEKLKEILDCARQAVLDDSPVPESCFTAAVPGFKAGFQAAERAKDCITTGDVDTIEAKVDSFVEELLSELIISED